MKRKMDWQGGQVALIVLLMAAVVLTVGISVASRNVSEVRVTEEEETSTEAFNVAEGAIEDILSRDLSIDTSNPNPAPQPIRIGSYDANCTDVALSGLDDIIVYPGHSVEFNTTNADGGTGIVIEYDNTPSIVVTVFNSDGTIKRKAYNTKSRSNEFDENQINDPNKDLEVTGLLAGNSEFARIKVLYDSSTLSIRGENWAGDAAVQMNRITCQAADMEGSSRAVEMSRAASSLPSIFDYVLFSGDGPLEQQ